MAIFAILCSIGVFPSTTDVSKKVVLAMLLGLVANSLAMVLRSLAIGYNFASSLERFTFIVNASQTEERKLY